MVPSTLLCDVQCSGRPNKGGRLELVDLVRGDKTRRLLPACLFTCLHVNGAYLRGEGTSRARLADVRHVEP